MTTRKEKDRKAVKSAIRADRRAKNQRRAFECGFHLTSY